MDAIQKQKIGLCIGGTKLRQSGFTPLVISGILACEVKKMDTPSLVQEKPAYIITHTNEYILYQLIDSYVKSYDYDTLGLLSIALTIKKDVQLAGGKSPYSLLKEAYDKFRSEYMTMDNKGYDNFLDKDVNPADFEVILEKYPLEERLSEYIPMNSDFNSASGKLCVPQEKLEELFRDSQYPEFAKFKQIEIGVDSSKTSSSRGLENIEIPRPQIYALEVNGERKEQKFIRRNDSFDSTKFLHNTEDVKYERMSFNLGDLLDAPTHRLESGNSSAVLDKERNLIVCTIDEKRFTYLLEYKILGGTEEEREKMDNWILRREVKLTFGGKSPEFYSPSPNPKKTSIPASWAHQAVSYKAEPMVTFGFGVTSTVDDENKHVMVTITIDTPKRDIYSGNSSDYQGRSYSLNTPAITQTYNGKRIEDDHEEDWEKLQSSNEQPSNKHPSNKAKKRWILLGVCCLVSMCIGAGIVGSIWGFEGDKKQELTAEDLVNFAKDTLLKNPNAIITQEMIKKHASLRVYIKKIITDEQEGEIADSTVADTGDTNENNEVTHSTETGQPANVTASSGSPDNIEAANVPTQKDIKKEILELVQTRGKDPAKYDAVLIKCREKWDQIGMKKNFSEEELNAIEAILNWKRYKNFSNAAQRRITAIITGDLSTYDKIIQASDNISTITKNDR